MHWVFAGIIGLGLSSAFAQSQALRDFRVKSSSEKIPGQTGRLILSEAHFERSPEAIWSLLNRFEEFPSYLPRVTACESLGTLGEKEQVYVSINLPWPLPNLWNILAIQRQPAVHRFDWEMVRGNMNVLEGTLAIEAEGKGSLVKLRVRTDPGKFIPKWLVSWGAKHYVPKLLLAVNERLKQPKDLPAPVAPASVIPKQIPAVGAQ